MSTSPTRLTPKQAKRARKKERRDFAFVDGIRREELEAYIRTRVVCDRCGQEQPFLMWDDAEGENLRRLVRRYGEPDEWNVMPCLRCGSRESAVFLDHWIEMRQEEGAAVAAP